jgi:hypothetical protein
MRPSRVIAALLFAAAIGTPALLAAPAWAASTTPPVVVHASPNPVLAGHTVTLSGSVGREAAGSDCSGIILYSDGFAPTNRVGDMIAVYATAKPSGAFSATTTIPRAKLAASYTIYLRCGGATLGGGALVVRAAPTTPPANVQVSPSSVAAGTPSPCQGRSARTRPAQNVPLASGCCPGRSTPTRNSLRCQRWAWPSGRTAPSRPPPSSLGLGRPGPTRSPGVAVGGTLAGRPWRSGPPPRPRRPPPGRWPQRPQTRLRTRR